jgi:nucleoside-diphosphate-sugar epimerase
MGKRQNWAMNDRLRSEATRHLVDAAMKREVERFIQQSVVFVYADGGEDWLDESSSIEPVWDVLDSALGAEAEVDRFRTHGGLGVVLRLARLYGPGAASHEYVESVRSRSLPIVGKGDNYVSSIHVFDAATALAAAIAAPDGTYNIGDDLPMRSGENLRALVAALGAPDPRRIPKWLAKLALRKAAEILTVSHRAKNDAFKSATGWQPGFPSAVEGWLDIVGATQRG